jgi:hypothetical protein
MTVRRPEKRAIVNVSVVIGDDREANEGGMSR